MDVAVEVCVAGDGRSDDCVFVFVFTDGDVPHMSVAGASVAHRRGMVERCWGGGVCVSRARGALCVRDA